VRYYPIQVDLKDKPVLVVGGGEVATRRISGLLEAGARVTVVAPEVSDVLRKMIVMKLVAHTPRVFKEVDLGGYQLVFAATNDKEVNKDIARLCHWRKLLCSVVSDAKLGDFVVPSRISRGDLLVTVSTDGKVPFLSRQIRLELEKLYGPEMEDLIEILSQKRRELLADEKSYLVEKMARMDLAPLRDALKKGGVALARQWLDDFLQHSLTLQSAR